MTYRSIAVLLVCVALCAACSNDPVVATLNPRPEAPVMEALYEHMEKDAVTLHPTIITEGFQAWGTLDGVVMYDAEGNELQRYTGRVVISSHNGWTDIILPGAPRNFHTLDLQFNELLIGGGDVGGHQVDIIGGGDVGGHDFDDGGGDVGGLVIDDINIQHGGGDVGGYAVNGLVLPHIIVERFDGNTWQSPRIRFTAYSLALSAPPMERMELAEHLVTSLDVVEEGNVVGMGVWDDTLRALAKWPAVQTGADKCYDNEQMLASCEGNVWSDQCAETPFCGQDGHYDEDESWGVSSVQGGNYLSDTRTELLWEYSADRCEGNSCVDMDAAQAACEAKGMRLPSLWELRTLIEFDEWPGESLRGASASGDLWTTTMLEEQYVCLGKDNGMPVPCSESTDDIYVLCVAGKPFINSELMSDTAGIDTTIGALWNLETSTGTWEEALSVCQASRKWGFKDWRLPNIAELVILSQRPELDLKGPYWSATTDGPNPDTAWVITPTLWSSQEKQQDASFVCVRNIP